MTSARIHDPVHGSSYAFEPDGDGLLVDCWLEPGGALPEHRHPRQEERWWAVEGRARVKVAGSWREVGPQDGEVIVPAETRHALANDGEREVHLRCRATPPRGLEAFLTQSAEAAREGMIRKGGIPASLRGARWAAGFLREHGDDVVMSFPPRFAQRALIALLAR